MVLSTLFVGLLATIPVLAHDHTFCDSVVPPRNVTLPRNGTVGTNGTAFITGSPWRLTKRQTAPAPPAVPIYIHIVAGSQSRQDGYLTDAEVDTQMDIIHNLFQPYGITFQHDPSMRKWVVNASWAGPSRDNFNEMKEALHKGDYRAINLYIRNITVESYGGSCTNPWTHEEVNKTPFPSRLLRDGCVINTATLSGSGHAYMDQGKTAVHEIGHWFGLFHTYEDQGVRDGFNPPNPCWVGNPDDDVLDTPKCKGVAAGQCNKKQNTCPEPAGAEPVYDAVDNYMSESSDACYERFTEGQKQRMYAVYEKYRKGETRG
ncbi:hypothetical protein B0T16DRAFT_316523 [Cercophora newfieldiana]|uniref:Peptidase M43 pregnancy-associated plasma-A domain-containing protein n=1 Tax=Cercophora newfieldiana TaxID=92897 RepID=A0AA40CX45_9PEZI|nr:hypothetical protein B0T16DRAFT_316523 [Cercophora newfieldiana]